LTSYLLLYLRSGTSAAIFEYLHEKGIHSRSIQEGIQGSRHKSSRPGWRRNGEHPHAYVDRSGSDHFWKVNAAEWLLAVEAAPNICAAQGLDDKLVSPLQSTL